MRYQVYFNDADVVIETDNLEEATRYAQFNAGAVFDTEGWKTIVDYREV